jgi:hypothetical protein
MTALNRNPQNTNLLQPTKFLLNFSKIDSVQYFCQAVNLPGMTLSGPAKQSTPFITLPKAGDVLTYNTLSVTFTVDEDLKTISAIQNWLRGIADPSGFANRNANYKDDYSDAILTILTGLNNTNLRIQFVNLFPIDISDINFDTKESADDIIVATANFKYEYYNILTS